MQVMTTVKVSVPEVMDNSVDYVGIRRQFHPSLEEYSQDFVAFTMYSNST